MSCQAWNGRLSKGMSVRDGLAVRHQAMGKIESNFAKAQLAGLSRAVKKTLSRVKVGVKVRSR